MNVNGVGGAASLPMTLPSPAGSAGSGSPGGTTGTTGVAGPSGASGSGPGSATSGPGSSAGPPTGELRLPGQKRITQNEASSKPEKEVPKPAPLPPLKGLTVAEIRAMLGVAPLNGRAEASLSTAAPGAVLGAVAGALPGASSIGAAAFDRYA